MPFGAVPCETKIRLRIAVESAGIPERAVCIVNGTEALMHYCFDMNGTRMYECDISLGRRVGADILLFHNHLLTEKRCFTEIMKIISAATGKYILPSPKANTR